MANRPENLDLNVLTIDDLRKAAQKRLSVNVSDYFNQGAGDMETLKDNERAFSRYKLQPRILRDVDGVDTSTTVFGTKITFPLGFAPAAAHKLAHQDGEIATSRAASKNIIPMCLSSWSTSSIEDVVAQGAGNPYAMQITFFRDTAITKRTIQQAEKAGCKAIFVSVDLPILGNRLNETRNNFTFPEHLRYPMLAQDINETGLKHTSGREYDPSISWEKIPWLRSVTNMEIWLKGIYTPEDVQLAIDHHLDGVIISNHGGRQLDGVPATLDALRVCAPVAKGKIPLAIDGGIRRGADVFKAIALGASVCFVGRIPIWGLAYNGEAGVDLAIKILLDDFQRTMMLTGCKKVSDISRQHLAVLEPSGILSKL